MNTSQEKYWASARSKILSVFLVQVVVFLLLCPMHSLGQSVQNSQAVDRTVSGIVVDAGTGEPLAGVNILVGGTTTGTATDAEGEFRLDVSDDAAVLEVSYVGYVDKEVELSDGRSEYRIEMEPDSELMDEVMVVAYGEQRRSDVTGSISSAEAEDFNRGVVNNPGQLIQGVVSGVNVTSANGEPGAEQDVIIRGVGSLRSGTKPLYVIDGFALDNSSTGVANSPLNFLNPEDIESIEVLKDASATALYGARAANGVVVITTEDGEAGDTRVSLSTSTSLSTISNKIDVFSAEEFRDQVPQAGGTLEDLGASTNWQDELTRTALSNEVNLSLSGASSERFNYFASLGVQSQEGILEESNLERYSGRINMNQSELDGALTVDYRINAVHTENLRPDNRATVRDMLQLNPTIPVYTDGSPTRLDNRLNPQQRYDLYSDENKNNRIVGNIKPTIEILEGLSYEVNLGADYSESNRIVQTSPFPPLEGFGEGELSSSNRENINLTVENTLRYRLNRESHSATFLSGYSYQWFRTEGRSASLEGFNDNGIAPQFQDQISTPETPTQTSALAEVSKLQSFFGRANYSYENRYLVTATFRADGSSRFGENNRYGYFPSFALGWNVSNEDFFEVSFVDNLKLRTSWGQTGNQGIPNKITKASFTESRGGNNTYPLDEGDESRGDYPYGRIPTRLANPDLQWEVSTQTDVGIDFELFNSRLTGTFDYYNKVSDNILLERTPADPIQPTSTFWTNLSEMEIQNSGFELSLEHRNSPTADFQYSIGGNVSTNNNEVVNSPFSVLTTGAAQGAGQTGATINGYINGESIGAFYMLEHDGIGEDGLNEFVDRNGDGEVLEDDRFVAGSALPDVLFGLQVGLDYKDFGLRLNFNGAAGHQIYNHTAMSIFNRGNLAANSNTTEFATEFPEEDISNSNTVSTRYLEDGDYVRLNSATLSYNVNPDLIGLSGAVRNLELTVTGQNLFLITGYSGFDPEVNTGTEIDGIKTFGIDRFTYPSPRTYQVGVNLSF